MIFQLFIIGFITLLGQIVIIRELNVAFFGIELIYILSVGIWMTGTAAGVLFRKNTIQPTPRLLNLAFILFAVLLICDLFFIRSVRILFSDVPGLYLPFHIQILALLISLFPVSYLSGVLFQWAARLHVMNHSSLAKAYAIESLGAIAAGIISTFLFYIGIQNITALFSCAFITLIIPSVQFVKKFKPGIILLPLFFVFIIYLSGIIDKMTTSWNHQYIYETKDTAYGRITITNYKNMFSVFENDALIYESETTAAEEFIHVTMLQHANPRNILLLGGGFAGLITELSKYDSINIDYVEINKSLFELMKSLVPDSVKTFLMSDYINIIYDDPKRFISKSGIYDIIFLNFAGPVSLQNNRFYTLEFFRACKERLNYSGILSFQLPGAENLWTSQIKMLNNSIYNSLKNSYSNIHVLPGSKSLFLASESSDKFDFLTIKERIEQRNIRARLVSAEYINYLFNNDRYAYIRNQLRFSDIPSNSNDYPVCFLFTVMMWLSIFFPAFASYEINYHAYSFNFMLIFLVLSTMTLLISNKFKKIEKVKIAFLAGFFGIVMETVIIFYYQNYNGALFQNIGLLFAAFMAGLSAGSFILHKVYLRKISVFIKNAYIIPASIAILLIVTALFLFFDIAPGLLSAFLGLFMTGMLTSALFAYASLHETINQEAIVSPLYAADVLGGAIGSVLASLLFIPFFGFLDTVLILLFILLIMMIPYKNRSI